MNDEPSTTKQWGACPPDELQKLARRLHRQRRDRNVAKGVGLAGALLVLLLVGGLAVQQFRGPHDGLQPYGDISCREVQTHIQQYVAGQLDQQLAKRMQIHLDQCPACGPLLRRMTVEMQHEVSFSPVAGSRPACTCGHCRQPLLATEPAFLAHRSDAVSVAMHVPR